MMTPNDIKSYNFGKGLFGYKKTDVDQHLETVNRAYEEMYNDNKKLRDEIDQLKKQLEEKNLEVYELEKKVNGEGSSDKSDSDKKEAKKEEKKDDDIKMEEVKPSSDSTFEDPFTDTSSSSSGKIKMAGSDKKEEKKDDSATSKFFQQSNDDVFGDDDDVFVGEIEEARKPNKVMIGDGEEESDDFEFL